MLHQEHIRIITKRNILIGEMDNVDGIFNVNKILTNIQKGLGECFAIYLFGSYADGTENKDSDVDFAVFIRNKKLVALDWYSTKQDLEMLLKKDVHLVDILQVSPILQNEIISKGKALYIKNQEKLNNAIMQIGAAYIDLMEQNKELYEHILKDKKIYG